MNLGDMIRSARLSTGISARELARAVGLSHSYISQVEMGGISSPSPVVLKKICCELKTLDYRLLLVASGYITRADELGDPIEVSEPTQSKTTARTRHSARNYGEDIVISNNGDLVRPANTGIAWRIVHALNGTANTKFTAYERGVSIPVVGAIPAGNASVCTVVDSEPLDSVRLPDNVRGLGPLVGMRVIGDSMIDDGILDGDVIIVDKGASPNCGDICAVQVEGEHPTIKRVLISKEFFVLVPANSAYLPTVVNADEIGRTVSIIGRVVHCSRAY